MNEEELIVRRIKKIKNNLEKGYVYGGHGSKATEDIAFLLGLFKHCDVDRIQWQLEKDGK